jgi:uncharacterized protein (DUF433 family)/uncharacterized OB-fold protein
MGRRRIKASEILFDILLGMTNSELMDKYNISALGLEKVLGELLARGSLKQAEVESRLPVIQRTETAVTECPKCGAAQSSGAQNCSVCGNQLTEGVTTRSATHAKPAHRSVRDGLKDMLSGAILDDIRDGLTDEELMEKYMVSRQAILNLLSKFLWQGVLTHEDLEKRRSLAKTVYMPTFTCPSCKKIHFEKHDRCPNCNAEMKHGLAGPTRPKRNR